MTNGLTPIQMANWQMLLMLATAAKADLIGACCSYRMERCLAERILEMTPLELMSHAVNAGDESLFPPRPDLGEIFAIPLPLSEAMLGVRHLNGCSEVTLVASRAAVSSPMVDRLAQA